VTKEKKFYNIDTSGMYYKYMVIVNDDSGIIIKWSSKLIDATRGVIYDRHMFIVQAPGRWGSKLLFLGLSEAMTERKLEAIHFMAAIEET